MSFNFREYTSYQLSIFKNCQNEYVKRKVARLKLQKFICIEKASQKLAQEIIGVNYKKEQTLIVIGSTKISANSKIKGCVRPPQPKVLRALKERADGLEIGEFRTTKLCTGCHEEHITSKSPHRYQFCSKCGITWDRDVNAGKNILYLGLCLIEQRNKHINFQKNNVINLKVK